MNDMIIDSSRHGTKKSKNKIPSNESWLMRQSMQHAFQAQTAAEIKTQLLKNKANDKSQTNNLEIRDSSTDTHRTSLFVTGEPSYISTKNQRLVVTKQHKVIEDIPWRHLRNVIIMGNHQITTQAKHSSLKLNIPIHFLTTQGRYLGVMWNAKPAQLGHTLWLKQQHAFTNDLRRIELIKVLVNTRIRHMSEIIKQLQGDTGAELRQSFRKLSKQVLQSNDIDQIRGYEGAATARYFTSLRQLIPTQWQFKKRQYNPATDPVNALLSLGYSILRMQIESFIRIEGLLPWQGFYHIGRGRHAALASDLMEPFRHIVERLIVRLITRGDIHFDNFISSKRECRASSEVTKLFIHRLMLELDKSLKERGGANKQTKILHSMQTQTQSLASHVMYQTPFKPWRYH